MPCILNWLSLRFNIVLQLAVVWGDNWSLIRKKCKYNDVLSARRKDKEGGLSLYNELLDILFIVSPYLHTNTSFHSMQMLPLSKIQQHIPIDTTNLKRSDDASLGCDTVQTSTYIQLDCRSATHTHTKSIFQQTVRAATLSRPLLESSPRGESRYIQTIFV